jgi:hypothetical protein
MRSHVFYLLPACLLAMTLLIPTPLEANVMWALHSFHSCSAPNNFPVLSCQGITGSFDVQGTGDPLSVPLVSGWDITMSGGSVSWGGPIVDLYDFEFTPSNSYLSETTYYTGQQPWSVSGFLLVANSDLSPGKASLGSFQVGFGDGGLTQTGGTVNVADVWPISGGTSFPGATGEALVQAPWDGAFGMNMYITSGFVTGAGSTTVPEPSSLPLLIGAVLSGLVLGRRCKGK